MTRIPALALASVLLMSACGDAATPSTPTTATTAPDAPGTTTTLGDTSPDATTLPADVPPGLPDVTLVEIASGFKRPTYLTAPAGDDRLFVLQKDNGLISIIEDGEVLADPFLDLGARLLENGEGEEQGRGERGLVALAFHPDYAANGRFFVYYADHSGISDLVEYRVSEDPNRADPDSAVLLRQFGPTIRHYGGTLEFGPDGLLWLSIGEGGNRRDAGRTDVPRGGILRLDVSTPGTAVGAADNPFVAEGGSPDLWATGLRNPWRWSIDAATGLLYLGDVGHTAIEEINVQPADAAGLDYGWPVMEGTACARGDECDPTGTVVPVIEMPHPDSCSVIGGYVYRGEALPELAGTYFYSDYCSGWLRSFRYEDGAAVDQHQWFDRIGSVTSLGLDGAGELYVVTIDGIIRKLVPAG